MKSWSGGRWSVFGNFGRGVTLSVVRRRCAQSTRRQMRCGGCLGSTARRSWSRGGTEGDERVTSDCRVCVFDSRGPPCAVVVDRKMPVAVCPQEAFTRSGPPQVSPELDGWRSGAGDLHWRANGAGQRNTTDRRLSGGEGGGPMAWLLWSARHGG